MLRPLITSDGDVIGVRFREALVMQNAKRGILSIPRFFITHA